MNRAGFNASALNGSRLSVVVLATAALVATATVVTAPTRTTTTTASGTARAILAPSAVRELRSTVTYVGAASAVVYSARQTSALSAALVARAVFYPLVYNNVPSSAAFVGKATLYALPQAKFGSGNFVGTGTLAVSAATRRQPGAAAGTARAVMAAAPIARRLPTAGIVATATIRGEPMINNRHFPYAYPVGRATLSFDNLKILNAADAVFVQGFGYLDPAPVLRLAVGVPMTGTAIVTPGAERRVLPTINLPANAILVPGGVREVRPTWAPVARALLAATARRTQQATVAFSAPATMAVGAIRQQQAQAVSVGAASMTVAPYALKLPTATVLGVATMAAQSAINPGAKETPGQEFIRATTLRGFVRPFTTREWSTAMGLLGTATKQPAEIEDYTIDYGDDLSRTDEVSAIVSVTPDDAGLIISNQFIVSGGQKVTFTAAGGVTGTTYKVTVLVDTTEGRRLEDEIKIKVKEV